MMLLHFGIISKQKVLLTYNKHVKNDQDILHLGTHAWDKGRLRLKLIVEDIHEESGQRVTINISTQPLVF